MSDEQYPTLHPRRDVVIKGVPAQAFLDLKRGNRIDRPLERAMYRGEEITTVKTAEEIAKASQDEEAIHVCPMCEDGFLGYEALRIHAPDCVQARAARKHIWLPPGFSANAKQNYDSPVRYTD